MENQEQHNKNAEKGSHTLNIKITVTNAVILAVFTIIISGAISWVISEYTTPNWADELKNCTKEDYKKSLILLFGSGTVFKYLKDNNRLDDYILPALLPTEPALRVLREEDCSNPVLKIVMSAKQANEKDFMGEDEVIYFERESRIREVYLGMDSLKVIVFSRQKEIQKHIKQENIITSEELKEIIKLKIDKKIDFKIYTTSEGSGTKYAFSNVTDSILYRTNLDFFDLCTPDFDSNKDYIILCSEVYSPPLNGDFGHYYVKHNDSTVIKHLYLYFNSYIKDGKLSTPSQTKEFISKIKPKYKFEDEESSPKKHILVYRDPESPEK